MIEKEGGEEGEPVTLDVDLGTVWPVGEAAVYTVYGEETGPRYYGVE